MRGKERGNRREDASGRRRTEEAGRGGEFVDVGAFGVIRID